MGEFRVSPEAEADLDGIWLYVASESGSIDVASRVVDEDLRPGLRTFVAGDYVIVHRLEDDDVVLILQAAT